MNEVQKEATETLLRLEKETNDRWQKGDLDWIEENIITPETHQYTPGMPPLDGKGYAQWMRQLATLEGVNFSFSPVLVEVSESGEMAYVLGETKLEEDGKEPRAGKFVSIWTKKDGQWRCAVEANNFNDA